MLRLENLTKEYDLPPVKGKPAQVIAADRINDPPVLVLDEPASGLDPKLALS